MGMRLHLFLTRVREGLRELEIDQVTHFDAEPVSNAAEDIDACACGTTLDFLQMSTVYIDHEAKTTLRKAFLVA